ncbi:MAG: hypothetical protein JNJ58_13005 [Chitinophagaceae bacterium]|nr:hypothetical protein [Chitinophagaceae bacterium]
MTGILLWMLIQGFLAKANYYSEHLNRLPPTIVILGILPPLLFILGLFLSQSGRKFIDQISLLHLTILHVVRIPVELVLFGLYLHQAVPELMTFEGRNFDILAGLSAPFITWIVFSNSQPNRKLLLIWNLIGLALLLNIVIHAFLSAPFPLQQLAFDQPNIAILYFPFVWLPTVIVPLVLFGHLVAIRRCWKGNI